MHARLRPARRRANGAMQSPRAALATSRRAATVSMALFAALAMPASAIPDWTVADAGTAAEVTATARVVNGVPTQTRPTTGALLFRFGNNFAQGCSGTLIGCGTFLTAAHCVCSGSTAASCGTPNPAALAVFLQHVGIVAVASVAVDPTYSFGSAGDVAVLTLSADTSGVVPATINASMRPPFGTTAAIVGYGITQGGARDSGFLREGLTVTADCADDVDEDNHVCWQFTAPLGAAGQDSNTCNGDSGGPLFADLGAGEVVVGITSGGSSSSCLPSDRSFDADVFVHRGFIEGVGGADLLQTACGAHSQVGEPATTVDTLAFEAFSKAALRCRKQVSKQSARYTSAALRSMQSCLDAVAAGHSAGPCPDESTLLRLERSAAAVAPERLVGKCPNHVVAGSGLAGACAGANDAATLSACILAGGDAIVAAALDIEYADATPANLIDGADERTCQEAVGAAGGSLVKSAVKALGKCQRSLDNRRVASCPDGRAEGKVIQAAEKAARAIVSACDDAAVASLEADGGFGATCAGVSSAAALADCQVAEHAALASDLVATLADNLMATDLSFEVPVGATLLRVTLNGAEGSDNDLDVFLRFGAPASPSDFDAESQKGGMFESIEIVTPTAGTWHARVHRFAGAPLIPFQLTATSFE